MTADLWWTVREGPATLGAAVAEAAELLGGRAVGLLSTPERHLVVRLDGDTPVTPEGTADWSGVFSARLFGPDAELRWLHRRAGLGDAVVVAEAAAPLPGWRAERAEVEETLDGTYALWGQRFTPHPDAAGWCRAREGRLGHLDVPVWGPLPEPPTGEHGWPPEHLALVHREYVGFDEHGNAAVVDERLLGIRVAGSTSARDR